MPISVSYMGTKKRLAKLVADVARENPDGPFLDLFSGMCSVAQEIGTSRPIWCNDAQYFSYCVAKANLCSRTRNIEVDQILTNCERYFLENFDKLSDRFAAQLDLERDAISSNDLSKLAEAEASLRRVDRFREVESERRRLARRPSTFPYRLFTITYSGGYFSLEQCIEIDSIKFSIDKLRILGDIEDDEVLWLNLALCQAVSRVSNTTGHFAQFLKPKPSNSDRVFKQKRRSVWSEWILALKYCSPLGSWSWRRRNRAFHNDANTLLDILGKSGKEPSIIYADPPYTADHYSRYYHVYETLALYDYPSSSGAGQYRPGRFVSQFSIKSKVESALEELFQKSSKLNSELILSYPNRGLLRESNSLILRMLRKYFSNIELAHSISHQHSSFGASNGKEKQDVVEMIYVARP